MAADRLDAPRSLLWLTALCTLGVLLAACQSAQRPPPMVIAHRGFSEIAPENTVISYEKAIEAGARLAECDVYLSADGVPVVLHDLSLERTAGLDRKVTELSVEELQSLDAGSWKGPEYRGEKIPTLAQLLETARGRFRLVIEIKAANMEKEVVEVIRESGVAPADLMIFSFKLDAVTKIAKLEPRLPTTWLIDKLPAEKAGRKELIGKALMARCCALGLARDKVDADFVGLAHECGFPLFVWTVNDRDEMLRLARLGVDAWITDRPDLALRVARESFSESPRVGRSRGR